MQRGEEQNREEGEMAQKRLRGARKGNAESRKNWMDLDKEIIL